jgi:hypothetical protein
MSRFIVDTVCTSAGICSLCNSNLHKKHEHTGVYIDMLSLKHRRYAIFIYNIVYYFLLSLCAALNIICVNFSKNFSWPRYVLFNNCVYWMQYCHKITSCHQTCYDKYTI